MGDASSGVFAYWGGEESGGGCLLHTRESVKKKVKEGCTDNKLPVLSLLERGRRCEGGCLFWGVGGPFGHPETNVVLGWGEKWRKKSYRRMTAWLLKGAKG